MGPEISNLQQSDHKILIIAVLAYSMVNTYLPGPPGLGAGLVGPLLLPARALQNRHTQQVKPNKK